MALMRTSNPALHAQTFRGLEAAGTAAEAMTLGGTVNKCGILLVLVAAAAAWSWGQFTTPETASRALSYLVACALGGLAVAVVIVFKKSWAPVLAPVYALLEGVVLGVISAIYEARFQGIVFQAVLLTFGVAFALLLAYKSGIVRATENFKLGVVAATGGIALIYLVGLVLNFFGKGIPYIHESGPIGIGFSVFVVIVAAMNLVLDFDFIEKGAAQGAPKYMEWYGAFGLMVTLIWLYLEILRLLGKARGRR